MSGSLKFSFHYNHILKFWRHISSILFLRPSVSLLLTHSKPGPKPGGPFSEERTAVPRAFPAGHSAGQSWCHLALRSPSKRVCSSHCHCWSRNFLLLSEPQLSGGARAMTTRTTDSGASQQPTTRPDTKEELGQSSQVLSLSLPLSYSQIRENSGSW